MRCEYMVTYSFEDTSARNGVGRMFITTKKPITSKDMVLEVEGHIKKENGFSSVFLTNFIELESEK